MPAIFSSTDIAEFNATLKGEEEVRKFVDAQRVELIKSDPQAIVKELSSILPEADKKVILENEDIGQSLAATFKETLKNNCDGWVDDDIQCVAPWGFELKDISTPVFLYQGESVIIAVVI
jgi:hypothetical protein